MTKYFALAAVAAVSGAVFAAALIGTVSTAEAGRKDVIVHQWMCY